MSADVTHVVAEVEDGVHTQVSMALKITDTNLIFAFTSVCVFPSGTVLNLSVVPAGAPGSGAAALAGGGGAQGLAGGLLLQTATSGHGAIPASAGITSPPDSSLLHMILL